MKKNITERDRKLIVKDALRLLSGLNALSLSNRVYSALEASLSNCAISETFIIADMFYSEGLINLDDYRAVMFIISPMRSLDEGF